MVIWGLWKSVNDLVWRSVSIPYAKIVSLALGFYNQWRDAQGQHIGVLSNQDVVLTGGINQLWDFSNVTLMQV